MHPLYLKKLQRAAPHLMLHIEGVTRRTFAEHLTWVPIQWNAVWVNQIVPCRRHFERPTIVNQAQAYMHHFTAYINTIHVYMYALYIIC